MSTNRRSRHSRFPAVNREAREAPVTAPAPAPVEEPVADKSSEESVDLSTMTADEVVEWAGDDTDRRAVAVAAENERDKPRKTVLKLADED